jgi:hypothetical protein
MPLLQFIVPAVMLCSLLSCQAAYRIKPEIFPQRLAVQERVLMMANGGTFRLADIFAQHTGTVVIFWQSTCPCVKRYQERITHLYEQYGDEGIAMMYVSSNANEPFTKAHLEYEKRKSRLLLLRDEGGQLAQLLKAQGTPTAALFNQAGDLVFMGWIDNERYENETGRIAYLEDAIKDLLAKQLVRTPTSPMFGCPIR